MSVILETERLILREWTLGDADALFQILRNAEVTRYLGDGQPYTEVEQARAWLVRTTTSRRAGRHGRWAVVEKASGKIIGSCGFAQLYGGPEIDFGYVVARPFWGRGYATEAASACLRYGFEKLKLAEVAAVVTPEHRASRRVLEKIGFAYQGLRRFGGEEEPDTYYVARRTPGEEIENS